MAQVDIAAVDACIAESETPGACITDALATCDATDPETPAVATLCFTKEAATFNAGIAERIARLTEGASEEIATIARIETKYDVLSALLQCDRLEELSRAVGRDTGEVIQRQGARCKANAAGLTYVRLVQRAAQVE
ncbi:hypothetical protein PARPLA_00768 [Rhodobacteraceae bacterium THAF1]|nr:hypothetical protein FIU81_13415 [Palleronia sp. THAF1]VDC17428.1 hypothetical protein PARPLA_00768 [Rhodobacteraceae bacterium THAF1]